MTELFTSRHPLIEGFLRELQQLPDAHAEWLGAGSHLPSIGRAQDVTIRLQLAGRNLYMPAQVKRFVFPRDVRELSWKLRPHDSPMALEAGIEMLPIVIGEFISPGAKELLRTERIGYYDSGGSMYLSAAGVYLYVDKPDAKPVSSARALFSGRRAQVIHALLVQPEEWFGIVELAKRARVSAATVSQVVFELDRLDWVKSRGKGPGKERYLHEPGKVLDAWVEQLGQLPQPHVARYYVPTFRGAALVAQIDQAFSNADYAVTHEAAAQRYAPYITSVSQIRIRLRAGFAAIVTLSALDARPVNEGANLAVIESESASALLFRRRVEGVWLASPVQVYLDLLEKDSAGRSKEMADHLRKEIIGF